MRQRSSRCLFCAVFLLCGSTFAVAGEADSTDNLTPGKPIVLFDGKTLKGWNAANGGPPPIAWTVKDGAIYRKRKGTRGHLFFQREFGNFEFSFQWKISPGGNSGVKYRVQKYSGRTLGCEYQLMDDRGRLFAKNSTGALYALYEPTKNKHLKPVGEWNSAKIVVRGAKIEHWLNEQKIVEAIIGTEDWKRRLAASKFKSHANFAKKPAGRIMLQDYGREVWFRKLTLTPFEAKSAE